jgi:hypothetical protein
VNPNDAEAMRCVEPLLGPDEIETFGAVVLVVPVVLDVVVEVVVLDPAPPAAFASCPPVGVPPATPPFGLDGPVRPPPV